MRNILLPVLFVWFSTSLVHARIMSPEDSVHRLLDGSTNSRVEKYEPGLVGDMKKIKDQATKRVTDVWKRVGTKLGVVQEDPHAVALRERAKRLEEKRNQEQMILTEKVESLPSVEQRTEQAEFQNLIQRTKSQVANTKPIEVIDQGRPGTSTLPNTKAGVPYFDLTEEQKRKNKDGQVRIVKVKVEDVPKLDIGIEKSIQKKDFLPPELANILKEPGKATALKTPPHLDQKTYESWTKRQIAAVEAWTGPKDGDFGLGKIVTIDKVASVDVEMKPEETIKELKEMHKIDGKDLKMLTALVLYARGDKCHVASGLFHDLSGVERYRDEANFYLGVCAHKMGFHSEAVSRLLKVVRAEDPHFAAEAIENLVEDLPTEFEGDVAKALKALKNKEFITAKALDAANYIIARGAREQNRWSEAIQYAGRVKDTSPLYAKAQYLKGVAQYASGEMRQAEKTLEDLSAWMAKGKDDKNLRALIAVNLGRMKFKMKRYEAAYQDYMKVPKDHPLWVEALVEQGWTQLNKGDAPGAIGNMYSLHSPYFQSVFMPDSWVVRTVGYIDICQYGDAYRTLTKLDQMHGNFLKEIKTYEDKKKPASSYYETVRNYLRGQSNRSVDGLSAQVIREIARQRGFLNIQDSINRVEDELSQYEFIGGLVAKDIRQLKARKAKAIERRQKAEADIAKIATNKELAKFEPQWRGAIRAETALVSRLNFEIYVHESSKRGFQEFKRAASARINKDKQSYRVAAGQELRKNLRSVKEQLEGILEGNEFLRYEIFAGSGEDIRYQAAGGKTVATSRIPANVKPQKILNWEFDGEYWEDEIGSYRSTLRNNCPNRTAAIGN